MPGPGLIILAAGASSRMGKPKQLLPWRGGTLLKHACETALATSLSPIIVVLGCEAESCLKEIAGLDVATVINTDWSNGMGASVAVGVKALLEIESNAPGALFMLVDQPSVTPAHLAALHSHWSKRHSPIVATRYDDVGGVPALFSNDFFAELSSLTSDKGARQIIAREAQSSEFLELGSPLIDLDTPENYRLARAAESDACLP